MEELMEKIFNEFDNTELPIYRIYCQDSNVYPRVIALGDMSEIDGGHTEYGKGLFRITLELYCKENLRENKSTVISILHKLEYDIESETDIQGDDILHVQIMAHKYTAYKPE